MDLLIDILLSPINLFFNPNSRIYWLYLLLSILFAILVITFDLKSKGRLNFHKLFIYLFYKRPWTHPSSFVDYKYYLINTLLFSIVLGYMVITSTTTAKIINNQLIYQFGIPERILSFGIWENILYTIFVWGFADFGRFMVHYLLHNVTFLWEFHKFHHSAEVLNPLTDFRVHPVEGILLNSASGLFAGIITGLAIYVFPGGLQEITVWNLNVGIFLFNFYANLRHTHVWLNFPKWVSHILISPAQHQIHHSINPNHYQKNMGVTFAFWDLLFGTLYIPTHKEKLKFGLPSSEYTRTTSILRIYCGPFGIAFKVWNELLKIFKNYIKKAL
ncbi:MAG: sterol desaturase family protein [Leptospiraceae bacterium]|nr:sterol desaturase family protein [Leptospiraceae bacterium]MCP5494066.1 sterol desaturase family protein [Leptospiraceae bacterium]